MKDVLLSMHIFEMFHSTYSYTDWIFVWSPTLKQKRICGDPCVQLGEKKPLSLSKLSA